MHLTKPQQDLLTTLQTSYTTGLTKEQILTLRQQNQKSRSSNSPAARATENTLQPPINCPSWACVLLPCINHLPSVKLFKIIKPDDAEVLRDARWVFYDAGGLVVGDIIRINAEDIVPADCTVLSLGMDHCDEEDGDSSSGGGDGEEVTELVVDVKNITGEVRPKSITLSHSSNDDDSGKNPQGKTLPIGSRVELCCGSLVLEGSAIAVVTHIGSDTRIARWIREGRWPPIKKARNGEENAMESLIENDGGGEVVDRMEMEEEEV